MIIQRLIYTLTITTSIIFVSVSLNAKTIYSLYDLAKLADIHSQTIKIAEQDLEIARQQKKRAFSVLIPRATAYSSITEYKNDDVYSSDSITYGGKLTQSFTLNGKELIAYNITKKSIESRIFSLQSVRSSYFLQVARAYYNILSSQRYLEIADSDVERLRTYRDSVKEKLDVGSLTKTDLYRAEAELSKSLTEQIASSNNILKRKAALLNLIILDPEFDLLKDNNKEIENYQCSLSQIKTNALKNRPEIKEAAKNLEIASKTVKFNQSDYWPTLSLEVGYKETDLKYSSNPNPVEYDTEDLYVSGELSFDLFDGGLRKATINQSIAEKNKAKSALSLIKDEIVFDCEEAFLDYQTAKSTLVNLQNELKSAQENYSAMQMQFKYGMADSIDVMDANSLLVSAQRRISDAQYTYYLAVLNILYTKGELVSFLTDGYKEK